MQNHLLIIARDQDIGGMLKQYATLMGVSTQLTHPAGEAKKLIDKLSPKWVILESSLCDKDSLSLIQEIKERKPPRIVLYTQEEDFLARQAAADSGADEIVSQSCPLKKLFKAVLST